MKRIMIILASILVVLFLLALIVPFLIPAPPLEGTVPVEELADEDSRFIEVEGVNLHYKIMGEDKTGTPLILLHGFGASLFSWREVIAPLAQDRPVIAFDRPAFGLTERPLAWEGVSPYSPEFQTRLVTGLMDQLGIEKAILAGNSAGGTISVLTALEHPERVEAMVLVDPAIFRGGGGPAWFRYFANTPQMQRLGPLFARNIRKWGLEFAASAWHDPERITEEIRNGYTKPLQADNWDKGLWYLTSSSRDLHLDQRLDELALPTLVITGDDDRIVPTEQSIQLASDLPAADLVVIPNCGHVPHEECPEAFLQAVGEFLAGLPAQE